jgi:solute carrier family 50 protein (sugar transporter)
MSNDMFTLTDILGLSGNIVAIILSILPILIIKDLIVNKNTSKVPWLLFLSTILNCEFWMIYGMLIKSWPVYFCNGLGLTMNTIYLIVFFLYLESKSLLQKLTYIAVLIISIILIYYVFFISTNNPKLIGGIACFVNVLMFASPLQNIKEVYDKKDNSFIPIYISICIVINCIIWVSFGFSKDIDYFIIIPNFIGLCLSTFQIYLYFKFSKSNQKTSNFKTLKNESGSNGSNEALTIEEKHELEEIKENEIKV